MLTLTQLREKRDSVIQCLSKRGIDVTESVDRILALDVNRRALQKNLDDTLAESNELSRQIGGLMREGKKEEAEKTKPRDNRRSPTILDKAFQMRDNSQSTRHPDK